MEELLRECKYAFIHMKTHVKQYDTCYNVQMRSSHENKVNSRQNRKKRRNMIEMLLIQHLYD
jgi:hypothetical protein